MTLKDDIQQELEVLKRDNIDPQDLKPLEHLVDMLPDDMNFQRADARDDHELHERLTVIVEDAGDGTRHGDPVARTEDGLVVFLTSATGDVDPGDTLDVRLTVVTSRWARGAPVVEAEQTEHTYRGGR